MKYNEWLLEWLNNYIKHTAKSRTYERYLQLITAHIIPYLGEYEISALTPSILQSFVSELMEKGNLHTHKPLSANTVNSIISILQGSLKTANMLAITDEYLGGKIVRPKVSEKQISCFTAREQKQIESAVMNSKHTKLYGIILCLYTGVRIGELLALTWDDIDFVKCTLTISKTCYDKRINGGTEKIIETPKTNTSNRVIPMPKQLLSLLREMKKAARTKYVIANNEKPISIRSYQRSFELLLKKINIPHRGFHSLRHTFATRALECGMDVKTLSELLGHKNTNITLNRYVHSLMEHKREMMNRLGRLL